MGRRKFHGSESALQAIPMRLLSSANNNYNRDYHGETPDGGQLPESWFPSFTYSGM
jgi:hypothetical protein